MRRFAPPLLGIAIHTLSDAAEAPAADRFVGVRIESAPVRGSVHMMTGAGGNLAVSVGADGTLLVDDQFEPLARRTTRAIVRERLGRGESIDAIVAAGLGTEWADWGGGFVTLDRCVRKIDASVRPAGAAT